MLTRGIRKRELTARSRGNCCRENEKIHRDSGGLGAEERQRKYFREFREEEDPEKSHKRRDYNNIDEEVSPPHNPPEEKEPEWERKLRSEES